MSIKKLFKRRGSEPEGVDEGVFSYATTLKKQDPTVTTPYPGYHYQLKDRDGQRLDEAWVRRRLDAMRPETLDATSGACLDADIIAAVRAAVLDLQNQRRGASGHVERIREYEKLESTHAKENEESLDGSLPKLAKERLLVLEILAVKRTSKQAS